MSLFRVAALLVLLGAGCAAPRAGYAERVEIDQAEIVIFFVEGAFDGDVEASLATLQDRVTDPEGMRVQWRNSEEVDLDQALLASAYGTEAGQAASIGDAVLVDLSADPGDEWMLETGDILARQRGVQNVVIGDPARRLDPLCYWGGTTDLLVWLGTASSASVIDEIRSGPLADFAIETLGREAAFEQMLVLLEFQPELTSGLSAESMPSGLLVDVGHEVERNRLLAIQDDLESLAAVSSVIVRPPTSVRTVCP